MSPPSPPTASMSAESLTIRPEPAVWRDHVARATTASPERRRFHEQLGLPTDRPLVLTGHQAEFWHPGILAKYLAADAAAAALGAHAAWLVVDQDLSEADSARYPARRNDDRLVAARLDLASEAPLAPDLPAAARPPLDVPELRFPDGAPPAAAYVRDGLERIAAALRDHAHAPNLGRQVAGALADLLEPLAGRAPTIFATDLHRTDLFAELVDRMDREPERCIAAYNAAARAHPGAGIRPLHADDVNVRYELPLWRIEPGKPRRRVYAEDLPSIPREQLAPRALFMTGLLRLAGCDLFIHGTGGGGADETKGGYDAVTDDWLRAWLGRADLAPVTVVTATRLLPLDAEPIPTDDEIRRADWTAHHARHDPAILGDPAAAAEKRRLVERIRHLKYHGDPAPTYAAMHALLQRARAEHAPRLAELQRHADRLRARRHDAAVLADRTWPFPLYPRESLLTLRNEVRAAFGAATP